MRSRSKSSRWASYIFLRHTPVCLNHPLPTNASLGKRIGKDVTAISILYQLAKTTFHELVTKYLIRQQRMLFTGEQRHCFSSQLATRQLFICVRKYLDEASIPSPAACCKALSATSTIILFSIIFLLCTGKDKELKEKVRKESTKNNGTAIQQSHNLNPEIVKSNFMSPNLYVRSLNLYAGNPNLYSTKSIP